MSELTDLYDEYLAFLDKENKAPIQMAWIHGWRCSEVAILKGKKYRERIAELKAREE